MSRAASPRIASPQVVREAEVGGCRERPLWHLRQVAASRTAPGSSWLARGGRTRSVQEVQVVGRVVDEEHTPA